MKRRDFLRRAAAFSAAGLLVPDFLRQGSLLDPSTALAGTNNLLAGRILVNIVLSGGNDGINTIVPYNDPQYPIVRPTLAFNPGQVHQIEPLLGVGLHPNLNDLVARYQAGEMAIIQGVGYPQMNLSHFRGTDIWFSGSSSDQIVETGWLARFLEAMYPEFPGILPEMPFALQQSLTHRIPLTGELGKTGVIVDNPDTFYNLVNANYEGEFNDELPDTRGGDELGYMRAIDQDTFEYAASIQDAAENGTNTVAYPGTTLGFQLEIVAKLISGGLGTPLYLTAEYGFDTHAAQAGGHSNLMYSLGASVDTFMTDLENQGLADKVVILTQSEFGRRVNENGSFGTDHGTAAPMMVFGKDVNGGVFGDTPSLTDLDGNGNLHVQHDYRSVYSTILQDHFGGSQTKVDDVLFGDFGTIPFLDATTSVGGAEGAAVNALHAVSPNPISVSSRSEVKVRFDLAQSEAVSIEVFDMRGRRVQEVVRGSYQAGRHQALWQPEGLAAGAYLLRLSSAGWQRKTKAVLVP